MINGNYIVSLRPFILGKDLAQITKKSFSLNKVGNVITVSLKYKNKSSSLKSKDISYGKCISKDEAKHVNLYVGSNKYAHGNELEIIPNYFKCINPSNRLEKYVYKNKQLISYPCFSDDNKSNNKILITLILFSQIVFAQNKNHTITQD